MITIEDKKYEPVETYEGGLCSGCAFFMGEVDRHCKTVQKFHDCMPEGKAWFIFKEIKDES